MLDPRRKPTARGVAQQMAAKALERVAGTPGGDTEAQQIARDVYATIVAARPHAGKAPLWALGPLQYVATVAAAAVVKRYRFPADEEEDVAAYLVVGFSDLFMSMVGGFDRDHFEQWRAARDADPDAG